MVYGVAPKLNIHLYYVLNIHVRVQCPYVTIQYMFIMMRYVEMQIVDYLGKK